MSNTSSSFRQRRMHLQPLATISSSLIKCMKVISSSTCFSILRYLVIDASKRRQLVRHRNASFKYRGTPCWFCCMTTCFVWSAFNVSISTSVSISCNSTPTTRFSSLIMTGSRMLSRIASFYLLSSSWKQPWKSCTSLVIWNIVSDPCCALM